MRYHADINEARHEFVGSKFPPSGVAVGAFVALSCYWSPTWSRLFREGIELSLSEGFRPPGVRVRLHTTSLLALIVGYVEVDQQNPEAQSYVLSYPNTGLPFDFVWFTPRVDDEDACEKFKSQFERLRKAE